MSNTKGSAAEREVRDLLRQWWQQYEPETQVERTPASGGWHASAGFRVAGDLVFSEASKFPWSVEVKRREAWSPAEFFAGRRSPVWGWWAQAERDAAKVDRLPMLWARRSRSDWLVLVPRAQVGHVVGVRVPSFFLAPRDGVLESRGVNVIPVGYRGWEFLESRPEIWVR